MLAIAILCAIVILVIILFTNMGNEFRPPWASRRIRQGAGEAG